MKIRETNGIIQIFKPYVYLGDIYFQKYYDKHVTVYMEDFSARIREYQSVNSVDNSMDALSNDSSGNNNLIDGNKNDNSHDDNVSLISLGTSLHSFEIEVNDKNY